MRRTSLIRASCDLALRSPLTCRLIQPWVSERRSDLAIHSFSTRPLTKRYGGLTSKIISRLFPATITSNLGANGCIPLTIRSSAVSFKDVISSTALRAFYDTPLRQRRMDLDRTQVNV